jgi:hypothetical protein
MSRVPDHRATQFGSIERGEIWAIRIGTIRIPSSAMDR